LTESWRCYRVPVLVNGAIAQLGERLHGMQEVGGSIPPGSTNNKFVYDLRPHRLVGLGHRPFTAATGVRIPLGTPYTKDSFGSLFLFPAR
jgi:hypothetical protein